jgi:hypothetical protein
MSRDKTIKFLRTTKANLETQKTGSNLLVGEPYLVTDEARIAIGIANNNYSEMAKKSELAPDTILASLIDNITNNVSTSKHGLTPKLPNDATKFFDGQGNYDTVKDSDLSLSDITDNNASTTKHGFTPKLPNDNTKFLDGQGAFDTVKDSDLVTSDITTNNASSTKHGFCPKLPNNTTTFLRGDGTFATPPSGGKFAESKILTSNFSGGSGALTDITGLSSSIEANKKYAFRIGMSVDDQSESSYFYIDLPSGAVFSGLSYGVTVSSTFSTGTKRMRTTGAFFSFTTNIRFIVFTGILEVGGTAGNFKIQVYNASENVWVGAGSGYSLFET